MKKAILVIALSAFTAGFAQEDRTERTTTTKTTVRSSKGENVSVQKRTENRRQQLELENNNNTNQAVTRRPQISESTSYQIDDQRFTIEPDEKGYSMSTMKKGKREEIGKIRKVKDQEFYILHTKARGNSFGYFDKNRNFVVQSYDPESDEMEQRTFNLNSRQ